MALKKKPELTLKQYKIENAPVGTRFIYGSHSTLMIATDVKNSEGRACVSESGLLEWIPFKTLIFGIKDANIPFIIASSTIIKDIITDADAMETITKSIQTQRKLQKK